MKISILFGLLVFATTSAFAAPYDTVVTKLKGFASANPKLVQTFDMAMSDAKVPITGVRINKVADGQPDTDKIAHLVVGTHHGNERYSVDVALQFIQDLIKNMQTPTDPGFQILQDYTFYVVPVLNISGYNANSRYETTSAGKTQDPNRDYPDPCGNPTPFRLKSTKGLADFLQAKNVVATITIHGYIGTFTYPWGIYTDNPRTADDEKFRQIGLEASKENNYRTGTHTETIYPTVGAYEDWAYHALGTWTMLLEMANSPDFQKDSRAMLRYFSLVPKVRSQMHAHTGKCTNPAPDRIESRP